MPGVGFRMQRLILDQDGAGGRHCSLLLDVRRSGELTRGSLTETDHGAD